MGFSKEILSTEAVTTIPPQCFVAHRAAAISIQYINLPPIRLPNTLVSFGSTSSVIMILESPGDFVMSNFLVFIFYFSLHKYLFTTLQKPGINIRTDARRFREFEKISPIPHAACHGIDFMPEQAGIHIIEKNIILRARKMGKGCQRQPAFQHSAHHARNSVNCTDLVYPERLLDSA